MTSVRVICFCWNSKSAVLISRKHPCSSRKINLHRSILQLFHALPNSVILKQTVYQCYLKYDKMHLVLALHHLSAHANDHTQVIERSLFCRVLYKWKLCRWYTSMVSVSINRNQLTQQVSQCYVSQVSAILDEIA